MTSLAGAVFLAVATVGLMLALGAAAQFRRAMAIAQSAGAALRAPGATDEQKEAVARRHSAELFGLFLRTLIVLAASVLAPLAVIWLLSRLGLASMQDVLRIAVSPAFIAACTAAGLLAWLTRAGVRRLGTGRLQRQR